MVMVRQLVNVFWPLNDRNSNVCVCLYVAEGHIKRWNDVEFPSFIR